VSPSFGQLLRDGLRLALLLRPRVIAARIDLAPVLAMAVLQTLADLPAIWWYVEPPRRFAPDGLLTWLAQLALTLLAAAAIARFARRRALFFTVAAWLFAAQIPISLGYALVPWIDASGLLWQAYWLFHALWVFTVCLRLGLVLRAGLLRPLAGAIVGICLLWMPQQMVVAPLLLQTDWQAYADGENGGDRAFANAAELPLPETTMYAQPALLQAALDALAPQRPGHIDVYVVGFAGDAGEGAFRNEVDFLQELATHRLDAADHTIRLVNHVGSADRLPLATVTNLERTLAGVGAHMDPDEDILLLYLSSHGSEDHLLYVNQPPLPLRQLSPQRLRVALDEAGIRWRVVVVSACYSGGFIEPLADPDTLVITAARSDRTSFGCGNSANATWFGQAFLIDGLNQTLNFRRAFLRARRQIAAQEKLKDYEPSEPQWSAGQAISEHLARWRESVPESAPIAFVPSVRVVDTDGSATLPAEAPKRPESEAE